MTGRAIRAWVVRWEWAGQHAAVDQPVAAILRPQIGGRRLFGIVETLYAAREYEPIDMLSAIRPGGHHPYRAKWGSWGGEVICGHNPFLVARLARVRPASDGSGGIEWEDDSRPDL